MWAPVSTFAQITAVLAALTITAAITHHLTRHRTAGRYRAAVTAAVSAARRDDLTGLGNRTGLHAALAAAVERRRPVAVILINLDDTHTVVGRVGHRAFDELLVLTAGRVQHVASAAGAPVFRMRRDEFAVVLPHPGDAAGHAAHLVAAVAEPTDLHHARHPVTVTACAGVGVFTPHADADQRRALVRADRAMRAAKRTGRGATTVFDPITMRGNGGPPAAPADRGQA
ncbi:GGDEF domain-containing protein [Micromonospora sp. DT201]|uniref:GGDEF domain-containing protein n=1 Tax=Micromonospora sp. DT201 TaxID=3393442 RepID=UPI003CFBBC90